MFASKHPWERIVGGIAFWCIAAPVVRGEDERGVRAVGRIEFWLEMDRYIDIGIGKENSPILPILFYLHIYNIHLSMMCS